MAQADGLTQRISAHYPQLSESGQAIANYLQRNPFAVASLSVADLAQQTNTSKATVSRFFRQLGYASHQEAKQTLLARRVDGLPIHQSSDPATGSLEQDCEHIVQTMRGISDQTIENVVQRICSARRIVLIGYRNSFPVALHFRQQLKQVRGSVHLYPQSGQTIAEDMVDLHADDLVILLGFRRRPRIFSTLVASLDAKQTIMITDETGQIYNDQVAELMVCHLGVSQALDSYAAPMSLISTITNKVYLALGDSAQQRINAISDKYDEFGELG